MLCYGAGLLIILQNNLIGMNEYAYQRITQMIDLIDSVLCDIQCRGEPKRFRNVKNYDK